MLQLLVVCKIQNEEDLKEVNVSIGSEVLFLDAVLLKVYESYTINKFKSLDIWDSLK